ncbi:POZ domain-containing protein [Microthyrium microscopicum]|uniref:POZ domain-containing protein n=1 Tax=Microthyrium microscopicum TaxID=703497 RepID=A0A6A6U6K7_9PEZI|nr:POZ domain-containing protein [Microthyrium microscopicum]
MLFFLKTLGDCHRAEFFGNHIEQHTAQLIQLLVLSACEVGQVNVAQAGSYLESRDFADFKIVCEGRVWNVHRVIISARSDYFRAVCTAKFKEAKNKLINIKDENPEMIDKLLAFIYTKRLPSPQFTDAAGYYHLCRVGDFFGVKDLADQAFLALRTSIEAKLSFEDRTATAFATIEREISLACVIAPMLERLKAFLDLSNPGPADKVIKVMIDTCAKNIDQLKDQPSFQDIVLQYNRMTK